MSFILKIKIRKMFKSFYIINRQNNVICSFPITKEKKTNMRINLRTNQLIEIANPDKYIDGFDYSEKFDDFQIIDGNTIYIKNSSCSPRENYRFIQGQLYALRNTRNTYFANILESKEDLINMSKYKYLLNQEQFLHQQKYVYVGDLKGYCKWIKETFVFI
jgi:hypothetical protein